MKPRTQKCRFDFHHDGKAISVIVDPHRKVLEFRRRFRRKIETVSFNEAYDFAIGQTQMKNL